MNAQLEKLSVKDQKALAAFKQLVSNAFGERLRQMMLFGSKARGEDQAESDADVFVVLDNDSDWRDERQIGKLATNVLLETGVDISPTVHTEAWLEKKRGHSFFLAEVEQDAVEL